ncbi:MAG: hypothetical protein H6680_09070 [Desulfobacteraceae bacterium]|nr:hypothetical protein [Desulfobacteraceae bacterium]
MNNYGFVLIHNKEQNISKINQELELANSFFEKVLIISQSPEVFDDFLFPVIVPFKENSFFSCVYSGLFFMENKNIIVFDSKFSRFDLKTAEKLMKNLHKSVDAALFYENDQYISTPGAYSSKILNKFKINAFDNYDESFLKRLKINKIFCGEI